MRREPSPTSSSAPTAGLVDELPADPQKLDAPPKTNIWLLAGLLLVALNLRPALTSLSPLLKQVRLETGLSATAAGLLTTAPVVCLGAFAAFAPPLAARFGAERTILGNLLLLAAGLLLRGAGGVAALFAGTVVAGAAIGIAGVLLPGLVKRDFPDRVEIMTGLYTMALCLGAAFASGASVPISQASGNSWQAGLAFWALPALLTALIWWPQARASQHTANGKQPTNTLWRNALAWQVTGYMGFQSSLAYIVFGWLPVALIERGLTPREAGFTLSVSIVVQLSTALGAPWLAARLARDQRTMIALMLALSTSGFVGCLYAPLSTLWLWGALLGLGLGGTFSMGLVLIVLRAANSRIAAQLSGMAQGIGYLIAALGPLLVGFSRDISGGWHLGTAIYLALGAIALAFGLAAGRERQIHG
jgi:CP family cyanate transporter-like MFS transporter